jgi:hypothetical protein
MSSPLKGGTEKGGVVTVGTVTGGAIFNVTKRIQAKPSNL